MSTQRSISEIAQEIKRLWTKPNYAAVPYLEAMLELDSVQSYYGADPGREIVNYFLSNARSFCGEDAKRIKAELKLHLKSSKK